MIFPPFHIPKEIRRIALRLREAGKDTYVVGGALRDHFLGRSHGNDIDLASSAEPGTIMGLFPRVVPTGIKHGTVTILAGPYQVEVTTLRKEEGYSDGRRPDRVEYVDDIVEDLGRRDFTMNAMAYEIISGRFYDPFQGREDIRKRLIRCVGDPSLRFAEDGLRPLRAVRFAAQLGFSIEAGTLAAIPAAKPIFEKVSPERMREEFLKILLSPSPSSGLRLLEDTGLLSILLPELAPSRGCLQKGLHKFDVLDHLYLSADASPPEAALRLAALFHDAGKPESKAEGPDGTPTFHGHETISSRIAKAAMKRLRFPNDLIDEVGHLISQHMFNYDETWTDAAVRRLVSRVGKPALPGLLALRRADAAATLGTSPDPRSTEGLESRISEVLGRDSALGLKDLAVDGDDLAELGIARGPAMGRILKELLETVLDDPEQNTRDRLLDIAARIRAKHGA